MPSWLPVREADKLLWLQNFDSKLGTFVGTAGITAADVTAVGNYLAMYDWILARSEQTKTVAQEIVAYKDLMANGPVGSPIGAYPTAPIYPADPAAAAIAGIFVLIVQLAERIKNTAGYDASMGETLGIEPPAGGIPLGDPTFTLTALPGSQVRLECVKSVSDGILIESQRAGEVDWTPMGTDRFAPWIDTRAPLVAGQPEVRRYRIRYLDGDDPVGLYSAIVSVTTIP